MSKPLRHTLLALLRACADSSTGAAGEERSHRREWLWRSQGSDVEAIDAHFTLAAQPLRRLFAGAAELEARSANEEQQARQHRADPRSVMLANGPAALEQALQTTVGAASIGGRPQSVRPAYGE
jgi:hypothetical protein